MEIALITFAVVFLLLAVAVGWILTLFGMPGNWLMVVVAAGYAWLGPAGGLRG